MLVQVVLREMPRYLKIDFIKYNKTYVQEWVPSLQGPRHHLLSRADDTSIYKLCRKHWTSGNQIQL